MSSLLDEITALLPPPAEPLGLVRPWSVVEEEIGLELPSDYKEFIDRYGSGVLWGEVYLWNFRSGHFAEKPLRETLCGERSVLQEYEENRVEGGYECPYAMYPEEGGLFPFATLYDVTNLNWLTKGPSDQWDIVHWTSDAVEFEHFRGHSFSRFLLRMLRHEFDGYLVPDLEEPYEFTPLPNV